MKKLEHLGRSLSKLEQKRTVGGSEEIKFKRGECTYNVGAWIYINPVTLGECIQDINTYCAIPAGHCFQV